MFQINPSSNEIIQLAPKSFSELGFTERGHLQEWLAKKPESLGEELLIIQKEFNGFDETNERLDLLALDKQGDLVVIENKLDDSGRDVVWQALKYASYCASLSKSQIVEIYQAYLARHESGSNARDRIVEFFGGEKTFEELILNDGVSQRLIFVAANFRKEVTSTVMWLLENQIRLQCFKATPYQQGDQLFLTLDQIIPTPEETEFRIGISEKQKEQTSAKKSESLSQRLRPKFWAQTLEAFDKAGLQLYSNISPSNAHWLSVGSGMSGIHYSMIFLKTEARVEICMQGRNQAWNKEMFDKLLQEKPQIEASFGNELDWMRLDSRIMSKVVYKKSFDGYNEEVWGDMIHWLIEYMPKLEQAFRPKIKALKKQG